MKNIKIITRVICLFSVWSVGSGVCPVAIHGQQDNADKDVCYYMMNWRYFKKYAFYTYP
jgi:intergrase/recombinase